MKMYQKAEILKRIELRQSTIKDWLNCPLMYRFRHVEKLKPAYRGIAAIHGSALHLAIHRLHATGFDQDLSELYNRSLEEAMQRDADVPIRWKKNESEDLEQMKAHGLELLNGYTHFNENRRCDLLYSEVRFRVKIGGHLLTGTMDQVRKNSNGELDLVDLKSGMQRPNSKALPNDWQLSLYAYALKYGELLIGDKWIRVHLSVKRTVIYFLRAHERYKRNSKYGTKGEEKGQPFISCEKPAWDLIRFKTDLQNVVKMITKDWPFANPAACSYCAYHDPCNSRSLFYASSKLKRVKDNLRELGLAELK